MPLHATTSSDAPRRPLASGLLSGIFLIAAVVVSRRITGDLTGLSSSWLACGIGTAFLAVSTCCVVISGLFDRIESVRFQLPVVAGCLLPALVLGLTLAPSGSSQPVAVLLSVYASAIVAFILKDTHSLPGVPVLESRTESETVPEPVIDPEPELQVASPSAEMTAPHPAESPDTTHWMSRTVQDGCDVVEGAFRIVFAPGQRQLAVHLPFAPALSATPEVECEPVDGDVDVRIRVTSAEAWGVRIEVVRATELDQQQAVQLGYFASASSVPSAVAA